MSNRTVEYLRFMLAATVVLFGTEAAATPVSVSPTSVALKPGSASELITLQNESDTAARFEVSVMNWSESADGKTNLTPTKDLIVFPTLLELPARGSKKIRLGTEHFAAGPEQSYRLVIHELPQPAAGQNVLEIQVLTNMTLPIFLANDMGRPKIAIESASVDNTGTLSFTVVNPGTAHFVLQTAAVTGLGPKGKAFEVAQKGWYVLPGGKRTYHVSLAGEPCRQTTELAIKMTTDGPTAETRVPLPKGTCRDGLTRFFEPQKAEPAS